MHLQVIALVQKFLMICMMIIMHSPTGSQGNVDIGVCYGMVANNLPPPPSVINLYKKYGIAKIRLFDPNPQALQALKGSRIAINLGVKNEDIPNIAASVEGASSWFKTNVDPYLDGIDISYISVGNEAVPGEFASSIPKAMRNLQSVVDSHRLGNIVVTTTVAATVIENSYPPSASAFTSQARGPLVEILQFLSSKKSPLMINVYPYLAYASEPQHVRLDYALFTAKEPVFSDQDLQYFNLFDAIVDGFYWAMEKERVSNVGLTVSESGWPSAGNGNFTTPELGSTYNKNFLQHIVQNTGTPKRPGAKIEGYIFAMFNENQKPPGVEQHWGIFYPDMRPVYPIFPPNFS